MLTIRDIFMVGKRFGLTRCILFARRLLKVSVAEEGMTGRT
jgi:hypothetical protein